VGAVCQSPSLALGAPFLRNRSNKSPDYSVRNRCGGKVRWVVKSTDTSSKEKTVDACSPSSIVVSGEGHGYFLAREGGANRLRAGVRIPTRDRLFPDRRFVGGVGDGYFRQ
jgi:hypothetical protein